MGLKNRKTSTNSILESRENDNSKNNVNSLDYWKLNRHHSSKNIFNSESEEKVYIASFNDKEFALFIKYLN